MPLHSFHHTQVEIPTARIILAVTIEALVIWECILTPPRTMLSVALCIAHITGIALTPFFPLPSSIGLLAIDALTTIQSNGIGPTSAFGCLLGIGIIAYETTDWIAALSLTALCALQALWTQLHIPGLSMRNLFSFFALLTVATLAGCALRWRENVFQAAIKALQDKDRADALMHDDETAQEIHDAVTGELSLIARTAQQQIQHGGDAEVWSRINDYAATALRDVHRVIDKLGEHPDTAPQPYDTHMQTEAIAKLLAEQDERLASLLFRGRTTLNIQDDQTLPDPACLDVAARLLDEIYANIIRHARPESDYEISVICGARGVEITQINPMPDADRADADRAAAEPAPRASDDGGRGLDYYRRIITGMGGIMRARRIDGDWTVFALIPCAR